MIGAARVLATLLLLLGSLALVGCQPDRPPAAHKVKIVTGGDPGAAPAAFRDYGCAECHIVPGVRGANGTVGPPLTAFSRRTFIAGRVPNRADPLILFIMNPQAIKPGSAMPNVGVTDEDARNMAAYLYTLR